MSKTRERQALRAVRLMVLGSSDRTGLPNDVEAMASYGLGDQDVPAKLVGWLSVAAEREERGDDDAYGDKP